MTHKLLIVDDERANVRLIERLFQDTYNCLTATSGEEALTILDQLDVAVIITDQRMPEMTGIDLLKRSADRRPHMVRILLTGYTDLEALVEAVNCRLVYMYVQKPWSNEDLRLRVGRAIEHYEQNKAQHLLAASNERLQQRLKEMKLGVVKALTALSGQGDENLFSHSSRVSQLAASLGDAFGLGQEVIENLTAAGLLHSIGITDRLTQTAQTVRGTSTSYGEVGADILDCIPDLHDVADIVRYHRENLDGTGGPLGLIGEQIPFASQLLRVASEYELLTDPNNTTAALGSAEAINELRQQAGKEFNARIIATLSNLIMNPRNSIQDTLAVTSPSGFNPVARNQ
jgi:response regulator RpfG family c-di-GMP phosphodiesterase